MLAECEDCTRLTRQCLPTFKHGRRPSRHQRHTVDSLTPISAATSSALNSSFFTGDRATVPPFSTFYCVLVALALRAVYSLIFR